MDLNKLNLRLLLNEYCFIVTNLRNQVVGVCQPTPFEGWGRWEPQPTQKNGPGGTHME